MQFEEARLCEQTSKEGLLMDQVRHSPIPNLSQVYAGLDLGCLSALQLDPGLIFRTRPQNLLREWAGPDLGNQVSLTEYTARLARVTQIRDLPRRFGGTSP